MKKFNGCVVKGNVIELTKAFAKNAYTPAPNSSVIWQNAARLSLIFPS